MVGLPKTDWWRHWWWWCWCWKGKTRQKARLASHLGLPRTDLKLPGGREHNTEYRCSSHPPISHSAMIISIIPFCKCCTCSRYPPTPLNTHKHQILQMFSFLLFKDRLGHLFHNPSVVLCPSYSLFLRLFHLVCLFETPASQSVPPDPMISFCNYLMSYFCLPALLFHFAIPDI